MNVKLKHKPNLTRVELEITTKCNLKCFSCNRLCSEAESDEEMSIAQIDKFLFESDSRPWKSVAIMGGEPLLHTQIDVVLDRFAQYAQLHPKVDVKLMTNGIIKKDVPKGIRVHATPKAKRFVPEFGNVLLAPKDRFTHNVYSCRITSNCGLGLTRYGYFPCGCGASVARVAGLDIGIKRLEDVTMKAVKAQLKQLCHLCGRNLEYEVKCEDDATVSPFWKKTMELYEKEKPCLGLY